MELIRLQSANDEYTPELIELYTDTFPLNQRHTEKDFIALMESNPLFNCEVVLMNNSMIGFINYWDFDDFIFLEHLAVEPPLRGHKLGEKLMKILQENHPKPIVLEAERAEDSEYGERRIEFYRRLGFETIDVEYMQPPYRPEDKPFPLEILSNHTDYATDNFDAIKRTIYREVYKLNL